jgi:hypothetical protein
MLGDLGFKLAHSRGFRPSSSFGLRASQTSSLLFNTFGQNPDDFVNAEGCSWPIGRTP